METPMPRPERASATKMMNSPLEGLSVQQIRAHYGQVDEFVEALFGKEGDEAAAA